MTQHANSQFESLIELLPLPVCVLNEKRTLTHANERAKKTFPHIPLGRDLAFFSSDPKLLDAFFKVNEKSTSLDIKIEDLGPPKRYFNVSLSSNDEREHKLILLLFTDISFLVESEKTQANFVANVSHELRSPLTTLIGGIEALQGPARNDKKAQVRFLGLMAQETARMKRIVDELLNLIKTETQAHISPRSELEIIEVLERTVHVLEDQAAKKTMALHLNIKDPLPKIKGDRDQMIQVFHNLVDNAIKYGEEGTDINISSEVNDGHVVIAVQNWGDVIPSEKIPRLTERFYRIDKSRSRELGGTGLGLSIVKHIINRHRGTLNIKSSENTGTVVSVTLPILK